MIYDINKRVFFYIQTKYMPLNLILLLLLLLFSKHSNVLILSWALYALLTSFWHKDREESYLLTFSREQSPSCEANWFSASQEIPPILWNPKFVTAFTSARHLSLSWVRLIQFMPPHPTSWRSLLILSSHLRLGIPSGLFPSGFPTKTLYAPLLPPYALHALPISFFSIWSPEQYWVRSTVHHHKITAQKTNTRNWKSTQRGRNRILNVRAVKSELLFRLNKGQKYFCCSMDTVHYYISVIL